MDIFTLNLKKLMILYNLCFIYIMIPRHPNIPLIKGNIYEFTYDNTKYRLPFDGYDSRDDVYHFDNIDKNVNDSDQIEWDFEIPADEIETVHFTLFRSNDYMASGIKHKTTKRKTIKRKKNIKSKYIKSNKHNKTNNKSKSYRRHSRRLKR